MSARPAPGRRCPMTPDPRDLAARAGVGFGRAMGWAHARPAWQRHGAAALLVGATLGLYALLGAIPSSYPLLGFMPVLMLGALMLGDAAFTAAFLAFAAGYFVVAAPASAPASAPAPVGFAPALLLTLLAIAIVQALLRELRARPGPASVAALRESAAERRERDAQARRLADAVENAAFGIAIADPVTDRIRFANPAYAALRGASVRELLGKPAIQAYARSELPRIPVMMESSDRIGHVEFDTWYKRSDGTSFPVRNGITSVLNEKGAVRYRLIYAADASPRQRAEEAGRESEARFRATFEQAAVGIAHLDLGGRILRANDRFCAIAGFPRDELMRRRAQDLVVPDDLARGRASWDALLDGRTPHYSVDRRQLRANGSQVWVRATTSMVRDDAGQRLHLMLVLVDISELKTAEDALQHAQKMEAIGTLASGIAHDFNNMLGVVGGNLEIMMSLHEEDSEMKALAASAIDAVMRGADLTRRLLTFSRRQAVDPRALDINALLRNTGQLLRRSMRADIELDIDLPAGVWRILADPGQAEAAVTNLVGNARDAMQDGGRIHITTANRRITAEEAERSPDVPAGDYVVIEVADTGTGIAPEVLPHVFEPFFTTKPPGAGTGLGLAMVFGFARQSDGYVRVASRLGEGTRFQLLLPRAIGADSRSIPVELDTTPPRGSETILLVEDNAELRGIVSRQLGDLGYRVLEAEDGPAAVKLLARAAVDLLMTDMMMPGGMNGLELAKLARDIAPGLPILLASAHADAMGGGEAADYPLLPKPFRALELARAVRAALG